MEKTFELIKKVFEFFSGVGFDFVIMLSLALLTEMIKRVILFINIAKKLDDIIPILICFLLGIITGIIQIKINNPALKNWMRIILGYPALTAGIYAIINKFMKKKDEE